MQRTRDSHAPCDGRKVNAGYPPPLRGTDPAATRIVIVVTLSGAPRPSTPPVPRAALHAFV